MILGPISANIFCRRADARLYHNTNQRKKETIMVKFTFDSLANGNAPEAQITVYDDDRKPLVLGAAQQLGRTGAGGSVYEIPTAPEFCAKLLKPQDLADAAKRKRILSTLETMLEMPECARNPNLAWPFGLVYDKEHSPIGYAMRRIPKDYLPFKAVFGGSMSVKRAFPAIGRKELAQAAKNFVETLDFLEAVGVRPADFNPENFMLNERGEVRFLDCDSYMIYSRSGKTMTSEMYFPDCAAPELLCDPKTIRAPRTLEQTCFSAAVLSFMLVMSGQHPYSFVDAQDGTTTGTPSENIIAGKCPLGKGAGCRQDPRWYALWSWLTSGLQVAFITTFRDGHANPSLRTPLATLASELGKFAYECGRLPERNDLAPNAPKPREANIQPPPMAFPTRGYPYTPRPQLPRPQMPYPQYGTRHPARRPYGYGERTSNFGCNYRPFGGKQY